MGLGRGTTAGDAQRRAIQHELQAATPGVVNDSEHGAYPGGRRDQPAAMAAGRVVADVVVRPAVAVKS